MKTVVITGASGGIGQAVARAFSGHRLILQHHSAPADFARDIPGATPLRCDIRLQREVESLFAFAGHTDILVNCCGLSDICLFDQISLEKWNALLQVNLTGTFLACRAAVPGMIAQKAGAIVNISSIWGQAGASCEVHYSAAKGGVIAMTKALAKELAPSGIRVNCVSPGYIETPMNDHLTDREKADFFSEIPMGRPGTPEEVAQAVHFLALSGTYITGQVLGVNGGYL